MKFFIYRAYNKVHNFYELFINNNNQFLQFHTIPNIDKRDRFPAAETGENMIYLVIYFSISKMCFSSFIWLLLYRKFETEFRFRPIEWSWIDIVCGRLPHIAMQMRNYNLNDSRRRKVANHKYLLHLFISNIYTRNFDRQQRETVSLPLEEEKKNKKPNSQSISTNKFKFAN